MASNKRPPLEMDDLTDNLKQSSGRGVDAFFSSPLRGQEEKKPITHEEQKDGQVEAQHPVPPVPGVLPVPPVPLVPPVPGVPLKRVMKERWPVNIYHDQYESLKLLADEDRRQGGMGSMSAMVREAIDKLIAERRQK
jgi:hypothetical protein